MNTETEFIIRWSVCPPTAQELEKIQAKLDAILDNASSLCAYTEGEPKNAFEADDIISITVYCDDDLDNFYLMLDPSVKGKGFQTEKKGNKIVGYCPTYEVVDESAARAWDEGMHAGWPWWTPDTPYELGGENSDYYKLGA